jgi:F-type H+-transporting ATPase subunit epsilon
MAEFQLLIYTQAKKVFDGQVVSIVVPAETGYLGVLAHHAPLVAILGTGTLTIKLPGDVEHKVHLAGGFLEVHDNIATLLVDDLGSGLEAAA